MTPEEIMQAYDVLVQEGNDYAAREAAKVGNSQRSIGGLAEVVANPSGQTSGLANYTYNRTMRPTVDSLAAALTTTGKSQAMDRYLKDELMAAKNAYEDAKNSYTTAATTPKTPSTGGYRETTDGTLNPDGDVTEEQKAADTAAKKKAIQENINNMRTGARQYYYYAADGTKVPFTVYSGINGGLEVSGGMSYTTQGAKNWLNNLRKSGAHIFDGQFNNDVTNQLILGF